MFFFLKILLFVQWLCEMMLWFTDGWPVELILLGNLSLMGLCVLFSPRKMFTSPPWLLILVAVLIGGNFIMVDSLQVAVRPIINLIICVGIYCLMPEFKISLLHSMTKWFSILLGVSLSIYLLAFIISFPSWGVLRHPFGYEWNYINYGFFVRIMGGSAVNVIRFSGPFMEPGHTGIACVFLLYANRFKFESKVYLGILLASLFFTFSLAGYVLGALAYLFIQARSLKRLIVPIVLALIPYVLVTEVWGSGDNLVNNLILARLKFDKDKGIEGNNRFTDQTNDYFESNFRSGGLIVGKGVKTYSDMRDKGHLAGAGYKIYMIQYGLIGIVLIGLFYYLMAINAINRRYAISFFILFCCCFIQRTYPFWLSWIIPYACSMYSRKLYPSDYVWNYG